MLDSEKVLYGDESEGITLTTHRIGIRRGVLARHRFQWITLENIEDYRVKSYMESPGIVALPAFVSVILAGQIRHIGLSFPWRLACVTGCIMLLLWPFFHVKVIWIVLANETIRYRIPWRKSRDATWLISTIEEARFDRMETLGAWKTLPRYEDGR